MKVEIRTIDGNFIYPENFSKTQMEQLSMNWRTLHMLVVDTVSGKSYIPTSSIARIDMSND